MKTLLAFIGAVFTMLLSTVAMATVNATCDTVVPLGTLSSMHTALSGQVGGFVSLSCYPDNSVCVGNLQVSPLGTAPVVLTLIADSTKNYTLQVPCSSDAQSALPSLLCTNGNIADPTKETTKTVKGVKTTTEVAFSGRVVLAFDTDTDTLLAKYVDLSALNAGANNLCGIPVWYLLSAVSSDPFCITQEDCEEMMPPMNGMPVACNTTSNTCFYNAPNDPPFVPLAGLGQPDGPPCTYDTDCVVYLSYPNSCTEYRGDPDNSECKIFCAEADNAYGNTVGTCIYEICATPADDSRWCDPWWPNGTCNSVCDQ